MKTHRWTIEYPRFVLHLDSATKDQAIADSLFLATELLKRPAVLSDIVSIIDLNPKPSSGVQ